MHKFIYLILSFANYFMTLRESYLVLIIKKSPTSYHTVLSFSSFPSFSPHPLVSPVTPCGAHEKSPHQAQLLFTGHGLHCTGCWVPNGARGALSSLEFSNYHNKSVS